MTTYLRYPHLNGDLLTFTAANDIWLAPVEGGRAWRLTDDGEPVRTPRFSPDGAHIAFISLRDGHPEAYVVPVDGGGVRRLTWWGAKNTLLLGWQDESRVLVASHAGEKNLRDVVVKAVGLDGSVERLRYGPAWGLAVSTDGAAVLSSPGSRPPSYWKRYRGGTAPRLWLDRQGDGEWEKLLADDPSSLVDPMWVDGRLAFVSDRAATLPGPASEQANVWVFDDVLGDDQGEPRQVTYQGPDEGYVRDAATDGRRIVWHSRGRVILLADLDSEPQEVEVAVPGSEPSAFRANPKRNLGRPVPDHGGDASLVAWRGKAFWLTHREGPARALAADSGIRVRNPALLGRTGYAVFVTDAAGEDRLEIHHVKGEDEPRVLAAGSLGRVLHLTSDPDGQWVATISHDGRIRLVDVRADSSGEVRDVAHSTHGEARTPSFSPDGRYLLWSQPSNDGATLHQLMAFDTRSDGPAVTLTSGTFHDHDPAFTHDGKHIVFLSERTFDPDYDRHEFGLSFAGSTRPWLIPMAATEPPPFGPSADGWRISSPEKEETNGDDGTDEPGPDLDSENAEDRAVPFPVRSGNYRRLSTCRGGVLWIEESRETGALGSRRAGVQGEPKPDTLQLWSFDKRAVETIVSKVRDYAVSGDGARVVVRYKDTMTVTPADRKVEKEDDPSLVRVDLTRLRFDVEPRSEWEQMFDENARIMRDHYWRADMDGVDWDSVVDRWRPLVSSLATHDDLVDLLWETVGELNTSHAYVIPPGEPGDRERRLGLLGADLRPAEDGWRIERILPGESSDPHARSPLRAAGVDAREGDLIVAVDGSPVDAAFGPAPRLVGAAGKPIELTLRRDGEYRRVVVIPLGDEEALRYQDWVRSRREYVDEHSGGRLGYVHIPDMQSAGWAQLHRDFRHATRREGLVVDVRYNRGGHTSQLVLARLSRQLVGWVTGRHYEDAQSYPDASPRGPVVLVANEYSGSDGDIINAASQAVGLGPVVGVRTWGGVVGIDGRFHLVDGTSITQPRYAFWLEGKGWGVENYGVDPDIEVIHGPGDYFSENDPQLDRAIEEALTRLEETPAASPPELPDPKTG